MLRHQVWKVYGEGERSSRKSPLMKSLSRVKNIAMAQGLGQVGNLDDLN